MKPLGEHADRRQLGHRATDEIPATGVRRSDDGTTAPNAIEHLASTRREIDERLDRSCVVADGEQLEKARSERGVHRVGTTFGVDDRREMHTLDDLTTPNTSDRSDEPPEGTSEARQRVTRECCDKRRDGSEQCAYGLQTVALQ